MRGSTGRGTVVGPIQSASRTVLMILRAYPVLTGLALVGLIALPHLFCAIMEGITGDRQEAQFSKASFLEEYYKMLGGLVTVVAGLAVSAKIEASRSARESKGEILRFASAYGIIVGALRTMQQCNHDAGLVERFETARAVFEETVDMADEHFHHSHTVRASFSERSLATRQDFIRQKARMFTPQAAAPADDDVLQTLVALASALEREIK